MTPIFFRKDTSEVGTDEANDASAEKPTSLLARMRQAVARTRDGFGQRLNSVLAITRSMDENVLQDLEAVLLSADIGLSTTTEILSSLRKNAKEENLTDAADLRTHLKAELLRILTAVERPAAAVADLPEVVLLVGVNGVGKTTTAGKLAAWYRSQDRTVLLCAADTFRAAAIDQLEIWSERSGVELVKTKAGGDPSAVLFDALQAAKSRSIDVVLVDTAGRLHTKTDLMGELNKMRRTAQRFSPQAPQQTLLVMDATTGQNGMQQARQFTESAGVTGIVLTKLDGTAKGGIVVAIAHELGLPVVFAGIGEKIEDLLPFDAAAFVESLMEG
jgi:fused signal recognition particle receptor